MNQKIDQKISLIVVPTTWVVAAIVTIVLWATKYDWMYYLIGICTGLLNFGLMMKTNRKIVRMSELYPDTAKIMAKRQAWIGVLLRILVFMGVFLAIFFKEVYQNPKQEDMWNLVIAFGGYATIKVVLIIVYLIFGRRVTE
ncbi:MAG: hypothetical protein HFG91_02940 [Acholeplasmatales bacterium]|jgi:hypothetical protein|nr:hypothetical protein [Acholeplasmatales bacterium]MCI9653293.1 hypothetical protein [Acholeplasmatales bacterium]